MRRLLAIIGCIAIAAACVPPAPEPLPYPDLPAGIGVEVLRDAGGSNHPVTGAYAPSFDRYTVLDGVRSGPTPVGPGPYPGFLVEGADAGPDGTARYPWNGFAGEGITFSSVPSGAGQDYRLGFPGGTCSVGTVTPGTEIGWISPSPDGARVVSVLSDNVGNQRIEIRLLVDGATCPLTASAHLALSAGDGDRVQGPFVWNPGSSSVVYARAQSVGGVTTWTLDRLQVSASSVPSVAYDAGGEVPYVLGWSVVSRLLVWQQQTEVSGDVTSTLFTVHVWDGEKRVIDEVAYPAFAAEKWNFGYFIPGTTQVVLAANGGNVMYGQEGYRFPLLRLEVRLDAGAHLSNVLGGIPGTGSHLERVGSVDPAVYVQAPNSMMIERFVR